MERDITPARLANAIMQNSRYNGHYILVEGEQDVKVFKSFFVREHVILKVMHGKNNLREVYETLIKRGFNKIFGIRDADFLRLPGNDKFIMDYCEPIFPTDYHDAEGMVVNSPAFMDFIRSIASDEKIDTFELKHGKIIDLIYELAYPLACLRLSNKINDLGLAFKPKDREGNRLKFWKFICDREINYKGDDALINTVWEYSRNRGPNVASKEDIKECLIEIKALNYDAREIANGHDLAEILLLICKKGLKSQSKLLVDAGCIEDSLFLAYERSYFKKTSLFKKIDSWQLKESLTLMVED
ncbi:DUF4435 domain-containing protein [Pantoea ananatis]|uniref:DUF4435 domain-containing protein n=1 Tax=Pantoea ananas TaxID=553 RepID=UPI001B30487C|nr:DUF4435 domain-containing protein [Pantoea ananatis]